MPQKMPELRPRCRPTLFMCSEAGMVAMALPTIQPVTGSVARAVRGASASPARPLIAMSVELLVKSSAWQAASSPTLRLVLFIYTVVEYHRRILYEGRSPPSARRPLVQPGTLRKRGARALRRRLDARGTGGGGAQDHRHHRAGALDRLA